MTDDDAPRESGTAGALMRGRPHAGAAPARWRTPTAARSPWRSSSPTSSPTRPPTATCRQSRKCSTATDGRSVQAAAAHETPKLVTFRWKDAKIPNSIAEARQPVPVTSMSVSRQFACIVTHRRAGKTVACINDLQRAAVASLEAKVRPRFAYLSPFLRQSKAVKWDLLRHAMLDARAHGATSHESELRVDYPNGAQVPALRRRQSGCAARHLSRRHRARRIRRHGPARVVGDHPPGARGPPELAIFIGTPKGRNAFFELWRRSQSEDGWFAMMLRASETGLIPRASLRSPGATSARSNTCRSSNAPSTPPLSAPTTEN